MFGNITGVNYIGGITVVLYKWSSMINCYNTGIIKNSNKTDRNKVYMGGISAIIGISSSEEYFVKNCYNVGQIVENKDNEKEIYLGQITGNHESGTITNCYYIDNNIGAIGVYNEENGTEELVAIAEDEMRKENFVEILNKNEKNYYLDELKINSGYPILKFQYYSDLIIKSTKYEILDNKMIVNVLPGTEVVDFIENIKTNADSINVSDKQENQINDTGKVATGMKLKMVLNNKEDELTIVVKGDINEDSKVDISDLLSLKRHIISGKKENWILNGENLEAADLDRKDGVNISDLLYLKRMILNIK